MRNIIFVIITTVLIWACNKPNSPDCFQQAGDYGSRTLEFNDEVKSIFLHDNIKLELSSNSAVDQAEFSLLGPENLLEDISATLKNGTLELTNENGCNWVRNETSFTLKVSSNLISRVYNWGSEGVIIDSLIQPEFTFEQEASLADNIIKFNGENLTINLHSSSGSATVFGSTDIGTYYCNGVCFLDASLIQSQNASVNNSGIYDMYISPELSMFGYIGSSGNIYYNNEEIEVLEQIEGSGEILLSDF